nr:MAG TPA: hypothetical protein [Caudoviricetes sp.]
MIFSSFKPETISETKQKIMFPLFPLPKIVKQIDS